MLCLFHHYRCSCCIEMFNTIEWANRTAEALVSLFWRFMLLVSLCGVGLYVQIIENIEIEEWYNVSQYDLFFLLLLLLYPPPPSHSLSLSCWFFYLSFVQICLSIYPLNLESFVFCVFFYSFFVWMSMWALCWYLQLLIFAIVHSICVCVCVCDAYKTNF